MTVSYNADDMLIEWNNPAVVYEKESMRVAGYEFRCVNTTKDAIYYSGTDGKEQDRSVIHKRSKSSQEKHFKSSQTSAGNLNLS